jgi:hypothetical protein
MFNLHKSTKHQALLILVAAELQFSGRAIASSVLKH